MQRILSWRQVIVLKAAVQVDSLPLRAQLQVNMENGVWRGLVIRGLLRHVQKGWAITERGRKLIQGDYQLMNQQREEKLFMDGKLPRYRVARTIGGWAVIDRSVTKIKMHNDVVERYNSRTPARIRCRELNLLEKQQREKETAA